MPRSGAGGRGNAVRAMSVDGVAEEPGNWVFDVDDEVFANLRQVIDRQDDVLLGRTTYDYWAGHWPTSDMEPSASFINATPKHVFTSTPLTQAWPNSTAVHTSAAEHVAALKQRGGGDIGVHGSATLARSLLAAGLVDELRLVVAPTIAGSGWRLFSDGDLRRLDLLDTVRTPTGTLLLHYRVCPPALRVGARHGRRRHRDRRAGRELLPGGAAQRAGGRPHLRHGDAPRSWTGWVPTTRRTSSGAPCCSCASHQEVADFPEFIDLDDVIAGYDDYLEAMATD